MAKHDNKKYIIVDVIYRKQNIQFPIWNNPKDRTGKLFNVK